MTCSRQVCLTQRQAQPIQKRSGNAKCNTSNNHHHPRWRREDFVATLMSSAPTQATVSLDTSPETESKSTITPDSTYSEFTPSSAGTKLSLTPLSHSSAETDEDVIDLPVPSQVATVTQNRDQLLQRFYDLHLGASGTAKRLFVYEALDTNDPNKVATRAAMDTLCIAQLATAFKDDQLMIQSRIMYGNALRYLSTKIRHVSPATPDPTQLDDIIGAIQALTPCAWFKCVEADHLDWMRHTRAMLNILEVYGWKAIRPSTRRAFYYNWKYRSFFDSITRRTKVSFTEPPSDSATVDLSSSFVSDYAFDVSGLLWRADRFLQISKSKSLQPYMVIRLLTELGVCIAKMKHWYLQWTKHFPPRPHLRTTGTHNFKSFAALSGQYFGVFPMAYDFSSAQHERDFRILCICLLNLDQAIMDLNRAFPKHCKDPQLQLQLREAEYDAATCATDLCMIIPWSTQEKNMAFACIHSFLPLHYAAMYFERECKWSQFAWCRQVSQALSAKYGIEIRYSEPEV